MHQTMSYTVRMYLEGTCLRHTATLQITIIQTQYVRYEYNAVRTGTNTTQYIPVRIIILLSERRSLVVVMVTRSVVVLPAVPPSLPVETRTRSGEDAHTHVYPHRHTIHSNITHNHTHAHTQYTHSHIHARINIHTHKHIHTCKYVHAYTCTV